jgi:hypothetical protein
MRFQQIVEYGDSHGQDFRCAFQSWGEFSDGLSSVPRIAAPGPQPDRLQAIAVVISDGIGADMPEFSGSISVYCFGCRQIV